jgi:hypothetical protein
LNDGQCCGQPVGAPKLDGFAQLSHLAVEQNTEIVDPSNLRRVVGYQLAQLGDTLVDDARGGLVWSKIFVDTGEQESSLACFCVLNCGQQLLQLFQGGLCMVHGSRAAALLNNGLPNGYGEKSAPESKSNEDDLRSPLKAELSGEGCWRSSSVPRLVNSSHTGLRLEMRQLSIKAFVNLAD